MKMVTKMNQLILDNAETTEFRKAYGALVQEIVEKASVMIDEIPEKMGTPLANAPYIKERLSNVLHMEMQIKIPDQMIDFQVVAYLKEQDNIEKPKKKAAKKKASKVKKKK